MALYWFQSSWFRCIIIESGIFLWWVSKRELHVSKERGISRRRDEKRKEGGWYTFPHDSHIIALSNCTILDKVYFFFAKEMLTSAKLRRPWYWKVYFLKLHMSAYLCTKFNVSSIILMSFRQDVNLTKLQNKPLQSPPWLGLKD